MQQCWGWLSRLWLTLKWGHQQRRLRGRLVEADCAGWSLDGDPAQRPLRFVGGMDISFFADPKTPDDARACAALVVCEMDIGLGTLEVVWERYAIVEMTEAYMAGFLAFREVAHLQALLSLLKEERPELVPDVILVDGNGVLHPRGFGLASHLGVICDACTVGVGKDLHLVDGLNRDHIKAQLAQLVQGEHTNLVGQSGRTWGAALKPLPLKPVDSKRYPAPKNPIYVSVGHKITLDTSLRLVKQCCLSARVPEPVRLADIRSREQVREVKDREQGVPEKKSKGRQSKQ
mmetsp:Transcript_24556/g.47769  ORF Transcript_24556/g.47769 Transcript_24556/m.47769 type:complete len:289 (-) Transcript_24556:29-895(-)